MVRKPRLRSVETRSAIACINGPRSPGQPASKLILRASLLRFRRQRISGDASMSPWRNIFVFQQSRRPARPRRLAPQVNRRDCGIDHRHSAFEDDAHIKVESLACAPGVESVSMTMRPVVPSTIVIFALENSEPIDALGDLKTNSVYALSCATPKTWINVGGASCSRNAYRSG